ncbi:MAG: hypothetical protein ACFCUS_11290 [Rubrimonas sp.]|uniref:hypothetical protein n=1 Tax=Rubrimonas sp. TaxID=2036015 RepID=UPI002FDE412D
MTQVAPKNEAIALGFGADDVSVHARKGAGPWRCVGRARWDGEGFDAHVTRLRAAALRACGVPVAEADAMPRAAVWLPRELVFFDSIRVGAAQGAAAAAQAALRARFGADLAGLVWVVGATDGAGLAGLAAVEKRTIAEARAHARRLGFAPGAVTLRPGGPEDLAGFATPPVFAEGKPAVAMSAAALSRRGLAAVGLGAGALALAAFALWAGLGATAPSAPDGATQTVDEVRAAPGPAAPAAPFVGSPPSAPDASASASILSAAHAAASPPALAEAADGATATSPGPASAPPAIKVALAPLAVEPAPRDDAPPIASAALSAAPYAPAEPSPSLRAPDPAPPDAPPQAEARGGTNEAPSAIELAQLGGPPGPNAPAVAPRPALRTQAAGSPAAAEPEPAGDAAVVAALPEPSAEAAPAPPRPRPAAIAERPRVGVALADAPKPKPRPTPRLDAKTVTRAAVTVGSQGRASGSAARQATLRNALRFDETALIGVFGGPEGRAALVRLATGEMRKVAMGSRIDGWTVSEIGDNTLRLRKGAESRRLSLPSN